jgi:hypothetical protein
MLNCEDKGMTSGGMAGKYETTNIAGESVNSFLKHSPINMTSNTPRKTNQTRQRGKDGG